MATAASTQPSLRIAVTVCPVCGQETRNPGSCSRSRAAKHNPVLVPKRRLGGSCSVCGVPVPRRNRSCPEHRPNQPLDRSLPIGAIADGSDHPACRHARRRQDARRQYLAAFPCRCIHCRYDEHIEVSQRRAVASFSLDTPIGVVNSLDNLVGLCPTPHREFDRGLLQL